MVEGLWTLAKIAYLTSFDLWPTCDLWPQNIMEANIGCLPIKFGYKQAYGWKVINPNRVLQVNFHIWPLTDLHDLWPQNIMEANVGHLPTKFGYKQAQGWKVINPNRILPVNFHIWPLTPESHGGQYRASTKFGYIQAYGWKVINCNRVSQVNFHIWPHLTFDPRISRRPM